MTEKNRKTIGRLLMTYLAVLIIPILVSIFAFQSAYRVIENSTQSASAAALQQTGIALEQRISEIETMTYELCHNNELIRFGNGSDGMRGETPSKLLELQHNLPNYSISNQFILDYFILFPNSEIVLNNKVAYTYENFFEYYLQYQDIGIDTWRRWGVQGQCPRFLPNQPILMQEENGKITAKRQYMEEHSAVTFLMKSGISYSPRMYVMILVDETELLNLVRSSLHTDDDYVRITGADGALLYEAGAVDSYREYLLPEGLANTDSFYQIERQDAFVTTHCSEQLGWNITSIRPYTDVMKNLTHVSRNITLFIVLSFMIGVGIAAYFSLRKNAPVMSLLHDNHALHERMEAQKPLLLNTFLERLLTGNIEEEEIEQISSYLQFPGFSRCQCAVVHFFDMRQGVEQLEQAKLLFSNTLYQEERQPCFCHDIGSDKLACILFGDTGLSGRDAEKAWKRLIEQAGLKGSCKAAVSLGDRYQHLKDLSLSAKEALHALDYKDWDMDFQLLRTADDLTAAGMVKETKDIYELIALLENCIWAGAGQRTAETFQAIRSVLIAKDNNQESYIFLYTVLDFLEKQDLRIGSPLSEQLRQLERGIPLSSAADSLHHLGKLCVAASEDILARAEERKQTVFDDMAQFIETHYQDPCLSLSLLSEEFGISETYLSQQFKKHFGENISVYIENIRMNHATDLLLHTSCSISEIAVRVGYNSSNTFGKVFNKKYRVSPTAYRNSHKGSETAG